MDASYTRLCPGGPVARTVEAGDSFNFDVDAEGRILGAETIGDDTDWMSALVRLVMEGRVIVRPSQVTTNITVHVPPVDRAEVGRQIVEAIKGFEGGAGRSKLR